MINTLFFGVWPYVALAIMIVGHIWRYKTDQYGWTTRTSQLSEKDILLWASPVFHIGVLMVVGGHILGLCIPKSLTTRLGVPEGVYHTLAAAMGLVAGLVLLVGLSGLLARRFFLKSRARLVTRPGDVVMYVLLAVQMVLGLWQTLGYTAMALKPGFDYRESVSVWFRSIFTLNPDVALMGSAPLVFQLHAVAAFAFLAVWPFSRLVHLWSAPVAYLARPPIVYRNMGA